MKAPAVSVVMSEYNTKTEYLIASISSILNQTFVNFEFIIVDDCGENDVSKVVSGFKDKRIVVIENKKNMGLVKSLNKAISQARAEYIVRMDTDDIAIPDRIEKIYNFIIRHPDYDAVGSRVVEFSEGEQYGILSKMGQKNSRSIMRGDIIIHPSAIIRKSSIEKVSMYKNYKRAEDLVLWFEMLLAGSKLYVIDDILLQYRVSPGDYKKRKIQYRIDEIRARILYYPQLGANANDYLYILKSIASGIIPAVIVRKYRHSFVLAHINSHKSDVKKGSI